MTPDARKFVTSTSSDLVGPGSYTKVADWSQRTGKRPIIKSKPEATFAEVATMSRLGPRASGVGGGIGLTTRSFGMQQSAFYAAGASVLQRPSSVLGARGESGLSSRRPRSAENA